MATSGAPETSSGRQRLRWQVADATPPGCTQQSLFDEPERVIGKGEFRGLEFLHVRARSIINRVDSRSPVPFEHTINAYRGCSHACTYCVSGDTAVLMADGRTKRISEVRPGDRVYGTERRGRYRRYVLTDVIDHWSTIKRAYRITMADGTQLVASADHRILSDRGWKHVTGAECGEARRAFLTPNNRLIGTGQFWDMPKHDDEYKRGYLCGMIRGDGSIGHYTYDRPGRDGTVHRFRLALVDLEALDRSRDFLEDLGVKTRTFVFHPGGSTTRRAMAIRTSSKRSVDAIEELIRWEAEPTDEWSKGFLAGIFDAEGSCSRGILRISNTDAEIVDQITTSLRRFGIPCVIERTNTAREKPLLVVRVPGGIREHLRFFHTVDPAITRKRAVEGAALKVWTPNALRVKEIEDLGIEIPMYDITTGTGDFIANGVVSHNCFARPTHEYLGLNTGSDFDRIIVVKVNAVERLRAELLPSRWAGHHIAMGTNTDPYQRAEGKYRLTRGIVEALGEAGNPFSILTKGTLVLRDLDVLTAAAERTKVELAFSIGTLDEDVWRAMEPGTPHPRKRVEAVARLNEAGIPCGVLVAPILPGLSDDPARIDEVVGACVDAGARSITPVLLHLRPGVREHYLAALAEHRPDLVARHRAMYSRGAYASTAERERVRALVRAAVDRHRGSRRPPPMSLRFDRG